MPAVSVGSGVSVEAIGYRPTFEQNIQVYGETGQDGVFQFAGAFYTFGVDGYSVNGGIGSPARCYKSTDGLSSWATFGDAYTDTVGVGDFTYYQQFRFWRDGGTVYFSYAAEISGGDIVLVIVPFDLAAGTWGSPLTYDTQSELGLGVPGVFYAASTPYGWLLFIGGQTQGDDTNRFYTIQFDTGALSFSSPVAIDSAISQPTAAAAWGQWRDGDTVYVLIIGGSPDGVLQPVSVSTQTPGTPWTGLGSGAIEGGLLLSAFGVSVGSKLVIPTFVTDLGGNDNFGVNWLDGGWNQSTPLDTAMAGQMHFNPSPLLFRMGGYMVCTYCAGSGTYFDNNYLLRFGYVPVDSFADPAKWTWQTIFDCTANEIGSFPLPYAVVTSSLVGNLIGNALYLAYRLFYIDSDEGFNESELFFRISMSGLVFNDFE